MLLPIHPARSAAGPAAATRSGRTRTFAAALALLTLTACGDGTLPSAPVHTIPEATPRGIVNGTEVTTDEWNSTWSFVVALMAPVEGGGYRPFCSGSVIASRWVLTAAHCLRGVPLSQVFVAVGDRDLTSSTIRILPASSTHIHASFDANTLAADVGLVELPSDADVTPVKLTEAFGYDGMPIRVAGFGRTEEGALPSVLRTTGMRVDDWWYSNSHFMAVGTGSGACSGDSGGPAIDHGGELMGLVSFGPSNCLALYQAGFTDGFLALSWAETIVGSALDRNAPSLSNVTLSQELVSVRTPVTVTAIAEEVGTWDSGVSAVEFTIDNGTTWNPMTAILGSYGSSGVQASGQLTPATAGILELCVRARDAAGRTAPQQCKTLAVYDPNAGFVIGNGTFDLAAGFDPYVPTLADEAEFHFMAAYKKGASVPTGQTRLSLKMSRMVLNSWSYDMLVVTGSDKAQFRGSGNARYSDQAYPGGYVDIPVKFEIWTSSSDQTIKVRVWQPDAFGNDGPLVQMQSYVPIKTGRILVQTGPER